MTTLLSPQEAGSIVVEGWTIRGALRPTRIQQRKLQKLISDMNLIPLRIRQELHEHMAVIVDSQSKTLTFWTVSGINTTYSDTIYDALEEVLDNPGADTQKKLQMTTGHRGPILIDTVKFDVRFISF